MSKPWIMICLLASSPALASQEVLDRLHTADKMIHQHRYREAIQMAQPLLDGLLLDSVEKITLAHRILGTAYCESGRRDRASEHFEALHNFDPSVRLDQISAGPDCRKLQASFENEGTRTQYQSNPPAQAIPKVPVISSPRKESSAWKIWVPFGTGQFLNEEPTKGWIFLGLEASFFSTAIASHFLFEGERLPNGTFQDKGKANAYRTLFWTSLGAGIAATAWGLADAVTTYSEKIESHPVISVGPSEISLSFLF